MHNFLVSLHSLFRWLILLSLLYSIFRAYKGYRQDLAFTKKDNALRHWTATIAHVQLIIGFTLYLQNPVTAYFFSHFREAVGQMETLFFGALHLLLMLSAIVIITTGSALAKRRTTDKTKFKTMLFWFVVALLIIFIAIPWPFSPFANRPYLRNF